MILLTALLIFSYFCILFFKSNIIVRITFILLNLIYLPFNLVRYLNIIKTNSEYISDIFISLLFVIYFSIKSIHKEINAKLFTAVISILLLPFFIHSSFIFHQNYNTSFYETLLIIIYYFLIMLIILLIFIKYQTLKNNKETGIINSIIFFIVFYFMKTFFYLEQFYLSKLIVSLVIIIIYFNLYIFKFKIIIFDGILKIFTFILFTGIIIIYIYPSTNKDVVKCVIVENETNFNGIYLKNNINLLNVETTLFECKEKDLKIDNGDGLFKGKVRWSKHNFPNDEIDNLGNY